ncbi:MAG: chemotaxis protein CheB [Phycisphaerales bacterium]
MAADSNAGGPPAAEPNVLDRSEALPTNGTENEARRITVEHGDAGEASRPPRCIAGVGASAGGLDALEQFFANVPLATGMAFVVVQHLAPDFKSLMDEILSRHTQLPIHSVEDGMLVERDAIYLIPPRKNMIISSGRLLLTEQEEDKSLHLPIDLFFRSLADELGPQAAGVIMSGTGSDGSRGLKAIREAGGFTLVQDPETAKFDGMPRAAIATRAVMRLAAPATLPHELLHLANGEEATNALGGPDGAPSALRLLFELLRLRYGIDFQHYKASTVDRRIERRITMARCKDLDDYVHYLHATPMEVNSLYQDLLIGVTKFNRDPEAFRILENEALPTLFETATAENRGLRIWVPGCATGEEPFSLAIALRETAERIGFENEIKVFATDVHQESLDSAGQGLYGADQLTEIPASHRERYFTQDNDRFRIASEIRKMVIFAPQNVIGDPPFTRIDLLSCRNMLIYFDPAVQRKVISLFHFALRPKGVLFLGPSETVGDLTDDFESINSEWRLFRKCRDTPVDVGRLAMTPRPAMNKNSARFVDPRVRLRTTSPAVQTDSSIAWAYEALLSQKVHAGFLVDAERELLHIFGEANQYLQTPVGRLTSNLLKMVMPELASAISAAMHRATRDQTPVVYNAVHVSSPDGGDPIALSVRVDPLEHKRTENWFFFVGLSKIDTPDVEPTSMTSLPLGTDDMPGQRIMDLESELQFTREHLQATNEELETSNEELQATNEELVAANEELQSTNEELQSSNEELQSTNEELHSVNEELHTVNAEHQRKLHEMVRLNADMENLLNSTQIGTIFLDSQLQIRKFTPAIATAINLLPRDISRPLAHISDRLINLGEETLAALAAMCLRDQTTVEREVEAVGNVWLHLRILPYIDETGGVSGVVMTFHDITNRKHVEARLRESALRLEQSNRDLQDFAYVASHDLQAPLRRIAQVVDWMDEDGHVGETPEAKEQFELLQLSSSRMQSLINDLLEYSRVQTRGSGFEPFDSSEALRDATDLLSTEIREVDAHITQGLLPTVHGDRSQVVQIFHHLIGNAIRFRGEEPARIRVTAVQHGLMWRFSVKDNGIGLDAGLADEVFTIFRKVDPTGERAGNGLGLAICKRVTERHGGRIWIESDGTGGTEGTEVFFTMPVTQVDRSEWPTPITETLSVE